MFQRQRPSLSNRLLVLLAVITVPLPAGEVSRWTLDDTLEDSVGANDGSYQGGPAPGFVAGHDGLARGALSLNAVAGVAERVVLPEGAGLPVAAHARYSVAAWVRGTPGRNQVLYSEANAGDATIVFQLGFDPSGDTGRVHVLVRNGAAAALVDAVLSTTSVLDGTWHHLAWVDDNGSARLYVDGAVEGTAAYVRPALGLERITIGATSGPLGYCCFLKAAVDDVRVFDHALSAAQVLALVPGPCPTVTITDIGPAYILNAGGTEFTITGFGFVAGQHFGYIGDLPLADQRLTAGTPLSTITGKSPRLAAGFYTPSVRCPSGAIAHAAGRVEAVPPPQPGINAVAPNQVSTAGGTVVRVNGVAFTPTMELAMLDAAGATVLERDIQNSANLIFVAPPHAAGPVDLRFTVDGAEPVVVKGALRYVLIRPEILWAVPDRVPAGGVPSVVLDGRNFTPTMELFMVDATQRIPLTFTPNKPAEFLPENANRVYFTAPPHGPGFVDLSVRQGANDPFVLARAMEYLPLPRPCFNAVAPRRVSTAGGEVVSVSGVAFTESMVLAIVDAAGATILPFTYLNVSQLTFVAPPHAPGSVDLRASVEGQEPCVFPGALEYVAPEVPEITSFTPLHADARGGVELVVHGRHFTATTQLVLFDLDAVGADYREVQSTIASSSLITAVLPAHAPGKVWVGVRPGAGADPLFARELLEFVGAAAPAPQEVEGTLVDGIAEIAWVNPVPYARVHVYRDGQFHRTVEGSAAFFRDPDAVSGGSVEYQLVGEVAGGGSGTALFRVARPVCVPPANVTDGAPGEKILHAYGGHSPLVEPEGPDLEPPDLPDAIDPVSGDDGGYKFVVIDQQSGQPLFNYDTSLLTTAAPNELVTGFRLLAATSKLRIGVHAARIADASPLSLRVLITPAEPGMVWGPAELTLPHVPLDPAHGWMVVDYHTQNPPPPGSPVPDPENPQPPHGPLPPGAYLLKVYAVGATPLRACFEVSSDRSGEQVLVPGAGCPPYPLVRVEPTNNFNPTIHGIRQVPGSVLEIGTDPNTGIPILTATIEAEVTDLDGDPLVKYVWDVHNGQQVDHHESAANTFNLFFYGYGTRSATLKVWDHRCGNTTEMGIPVTIHPPCVPLAGAPNFSFPAPLPNALHLVTDLGSLDAFEEEVLETFRVFVVDEEAGADCRVEPATTHRVQMGLFRAGGPASTSGGASNNNQVQVNEARLQGFRADGRECLVAEFSSQPPNQQGQAAGLDEDGKECLYDAEHGGRFWVAGFDMADLPRVNPGVPGAEGVYELWARGSANEEGDGPWSLWRRVQPFHQEEVNGVKFWTTTPGSQSLNIYDLPPVLDHAPYATGSHDPRSRTYVFTASLAPPGTGTGLHQSTAVNETIEGLDFQFPSSQNGLSSAEATVFMTFANGHWELDRLRKGYDAHALGKRFRNRVDVPGAALDALQEENLIAGDGGGGGSACGLKAFKDCSFHAFLDEGREIPVFKIPLLTDPFGGALLSVSFAAGVSMFLTVAAGHEVAFNPCPSGNDPLFDARFFFNFEGGVGLFAEIDTDVLLGIGSLDIGVNFGLGAQLPVIIDVANLSAPEFGFLLGLDVTAYVEVCGLWVFCAEETWPIYHDTILEVPQGADVEAIADEINTIKATCSGLNLGAGTGAGIDGPVDLNAPSRQLAIATSPNGFRQIAVGRNDAGHLFYIVKATLADWQWPPADVVLPVAQANEYSGPQADPEVVFMTNDKILLVWTQNFMNEDPALAGTEEEDLADPQVLNAVSRRTEITYAIGTWSHQPNPEPDKPPIPYVAWSTAQRLSNDQGPNGYRADGMVSLALDPTSVNGPNGPGVWAAWVRYETPDLVALDQNGDPQVQMRETSIYARQIFTAFAAPRVQVSSSAAEIDIAPDVAVAPDGTTFIAWVNDPIHDDLLEENTGREILYSRYLGNHTFSAPAPVLADASAFKGLLEPTMALTAGGHGLLVFTALPANAGSTDAGFGGARVLYSVTITGAGSVPQFGAPLLIGLKCETPIYAHAPEIHVWHPGLGGDDDPGFILTFQERGSVGSRSGAGNAIAMTYNGKLGTWGDPVNLTPDDRVHQDIAAAVTPAGEVILMHQSPYPARRDLALVEARARGRGGIAAPTPVPGGQLFGDLMGQAFPAVADPAISVCRVSDVQAAAGSSLTATVHVANRGFAAPPAGLTLTLFHETDGGRQLIDRVALSALEPGGEAVIEVPFTMPRRPVVLVAAVDGVEGESNPDDNQRSCALGAQKPRDLNGEVTLVRGRPAVVLRWTNGSLYDGVQIYRDGRMHAEVPGTRGFFVDSGAVGSNPSTGPVDSHTYCVRGTIGLSQSVKSEPITVQLSVTPPPARFIRGDANGDGATNISDPVFTLNFLFAGGAPPTCAVATDANADRATNISDAIYVLNHLFLGGPPPRAPYPGCGTAAETGDPNCRSSPACER